MGSRATSVKVGEVAAGFKGDGKDLALRKESLTQERGAEMAQQEQEQGPRRGVGSWDGGQMLVRRCKSCY